MKDKEIERYKKALGLALDSLQFYADPENYHAIAFAIDRPAGGFADDFSRNHGHEFYERPMPGKLARATFKKLAKQYGDLSSIRRGGVMYTKAQRDLIEQMWADFYPVRDIAKKLEKSEVATREKIKHMALPERDHHLVRLLNFYGRNLLKYGNTREQIKRGMKIEYDKKRVERSIGRADRQQVAIDYLKYEMDKVKRTVWQSDQQRVIAEIKAIKRANDREASSSKIAHALKMKTREIQAIIRKMK